MGRKKRENKLVARSIRLDPRLHLLLKNRGINLSLLARGLLEEFAEQNGLHWGKE